MDFSRLSRNQMIVGGGGVALIVSLFLNWDDLAGQSAFDLFSGIDIILLVIGIGSVAYAALTAAGSTSSLPRDSAALLGMLGILAAGIALSVDLEDNSAGLGAWLGLIAAGAIAFGAYQAGTGVQLPTGRPR